MTTRRQTPTHTRDNDPRTVAEALDHISPDLERGGGKGGQGWVNVLMGIKAALGDTVEAENVARRWSEGSAKFDPRSFRSTWQSITPEGGIGVGTLFALAKAGGWPGPERSAAPAPSGTPAATTGRDGGVKLWPHLDDALETFDALTLAKDDGPAREFFEREYALAPDTLADDWRIFEYPKIGRGVVYRGKGADGTAVFKFKSFRRNAKGKRDSRFLYGSGGALAFERPGAALVIVGGEEKAAAAFQAGFTAVSELTGEKAPDEAWLKNIIAMDPPRIVLAHDHDQAGEKANAATAAALEAAGYPADRISIVTWPPDAPGGYDLNDLAKSGGAAAVRALIEKAMPWVDPASLPIRTLDEIFAVELDDRDNLVGDRAIALDELNLLVGPPGGGKSSAALQLAVDAAFGRPWLGSLPIHRRDVRYLYLGTENSMRRLSYQLGRMLRGAPASVRQAVAQTLFIMIPECPEDRLMNVTEPQNAARIAKAARRYRADFVIVDPWIDFFGGDSENDAVQTRESLRALLGSIRQHNSALGLLVIHHSRVGAAAAAGAVGFDRGAYVRGSKALMAAARSQINLAPGSEDEPVIVVSHGKSNNGRMFQPFGARLDEELMTYIRDEEFNLDEWREAVAGKNRKTAVKDLQVLELVRTLGGKPKRSALVDALTSEYNLKQSRAYEIVSALIKSGKLYEAAGYLCVTG